MFKDNWEEKHGINLPVHSTFPKLIQGTSHVGNVAALTPSMSTHGSIPEKSNLQDASFWSPVNQPTSIQPENSMHRFDNEFRHQSRLSETRPPFIANPCENGIEENCKPRDTISCQIEAHTEQSLVDSNMQELIKFLSANYGPMKTPLEVGTPEYLKLVEILKQSSVQPNGGTNNISNVERSLTEDKSSICRDNQEITIFSEKKQPSEKAATEKLWEGSLQLSSSVTLSAVAFFRSGEKLLGHKWPEYIEVKGKVRLEAFEKYVQDLPRSRNRGLMVTSICWNEESSNIGLNGMKEVAKGYKKSSRVGFAQLLSGIDLYICPRSDPIITILAKYGFFKGMAVIDDKPDSMIGCVVWRKNRPLNPVGNTSDGKSSPSLIDLQNSPPGFSLKQGAEKKLSPAKLPLEASQHDEPLTLPLTNTSVEIDHNEGGSSSSSPLQNSVSCDPCNLVRKRPFEDDDLPEFDFGVACVKSTLVSQPPNPPISRNCQKKLDTNNTLVSQLPSTVNAVERSNNNGSLKQSAKKAKLFDDDDDMPEWQPPELHNQQPPQITTPKNFQTLPLYPPRLPPPPPLPSIPPPPRADASSSFSYHPFRPALGSQPPLFMGPPPLPPQLTQLPPPPQQTQPPPPPPARLPPPPPQQARPLPPPPLTRPPTPAPPLPSGSSGWFNSNGRRPQL